MNVAQQFFNDIAATIGSRRSQGADQLQSAKVSQIGRERWGLRLEGPDKLWLLNVSYSGDVLANLAGEETSTFIASLGDPNVYDAVADFLNREYGCVG